MTPQEKLIDNLIEQTLYMLRYSASQKALALKGLDKIKKRLMAELEKGDLTLGNKIKHAKRLTNAAARIIREEYRAIQLQLDFGGLAEVVKQATANSLRVALGPDDIKAGKVKLPFFKKAVASEALIAGAPSAEFWSRQEAGLTLRFAQQVRQGLSSNENNQQIISRIVGKPRLGVPGVMDVSRRDAAALVQTSVQAVANAARLETFRQNADVISRVRQLSTLDSHTSDICVAYSGAEWDLDGNPLNGAPPFNGGPPRHFNCRSVLIPITKTYRELGVDVDEAPTSTRASDQGPIRSDITFAEYLAGKGKPFQDAMLGEGRADLWRAGKITLRDLVSGEGLPMNLSQLRKSIGAGNLPLINEYEMALLPKVVNQPVGTWEALSAIGAEGLAQFKELTGDITKTLGLRTDLVSPEDLINEHLTNKDGYIFVDKLKSYARSLEKVVNEYDGDWSKLRDLVRATISVPNLSDVRNVVKLIDKAGIKFAMQPKNRFAIPTREGYRDILAIVRLPNGMLAELQIHVKGMTKAKNAGHDLYAVSRSLDKFKLTPEERRRFNDAIEKQQKIYGDAWQEILDRD